MTATAGHTHDDLLLEPSPRLRIAHALTGVIFPLAAAASAAGLVIPGLYRDSATVIPAIKGQDVVTAALLPFLVGTLLAARRGSGRATVLWLGALAYLFYVYTGAAFAYRFNSLFLLYVGLLMLTAATIGCAVKGIDARDLQRSAHSATRRRAPAIAYLTAVSVMLLTSELAQIVPALAGGHEPELITRSGGAGNFVYVLDLGLVVPLMVTALVLLARRRPWGYVLTGCLLVKSITMGLALLTSTWLSVRAGMRLEVGLTAGYAVVTVAGLAVAMQFFRHPRRR